MNSMHLLINSYRTIENSTLRSGYNHVKDIFKMVSFEKKIKTYSI